MKSPIATLLLSLCVLTHAGEPTNRVFVWSGDVLTKYSSCGDLHFVTDVGFDTAATHCHHAEQVEQAAPPHDYPVVLLLSVNNDAAPLSVAECRLVAHYTTLEGEEHVWAICDGDEIFRDGFEDSQCTPV